ncbi:hypothetical protein M427DRAFT_230622 [Gonapodya prolifera JEL478]|uniref:Uncharacterized protein n=1 Tax=Gonapodya prolifera (strain JEL478) TaxID=1344416 RepID=A0A138ZY27_GONPJ|nr:hypothetical protein M427DRAFT_230622 [Gonapodya prolifera JEL478]|eukprot:KXS09394.1 hypothetical protein M427DRAFT_230622 [Gonapodya prolifera JEL478]
MSNKAAVPRPPAQTSPNRPPRPPQTQRPPVVQPPPLPRSTPSQPLHLPLPQRSVQQSLLADVGSPLDDEHGDPFETQGDNQVDPEKELAQIASQTETVIKDIELPHPPRPSTHRMISHLSLGRTLLASAPQVRQLRRRREGSRCGTRKASKRGGRLSMGSSNGEEKSPVDSRVS